jgi:hypothetical protein
MSPAVQAVQRARPNLVHWGEPIRFLDSGQPDKYRQNAFARLPWGRQFSSSLGRPCDPEDAMKIFLGILAVLFVAASLIADYKWRQWMAARRRDRQ